MPGESLHSYRSFEELYNAYKNIVYNTCLSYLQNMEDAEEVTQNVFVNIHHSLASFRGESQLKTWIYRIAINRSLDHLKFKKRKKRFAVVTGLFGTVGAPVEDPAADFHHPGVALEQKEKSAILFKAINQLPETQRTAFILSRIEGMSNIEISGVLRKNIGAVESLLSRAGENLKKQLSNYK